MDVFCLFVLWCYSDTLHKAIINSSMALFGWAVCSRIYEWNYPKVQLMSKTMSYENQPTEFSAEVIDNFAGGILLIKRQFSLE